MSKETEFDPKQIFTAPHDGIYLFEGTVKRKLKKGEKVYSEHQLKPPKKDKEGE